MGTGRETAELPRAGGAIATTSVVVAPGTTPGPVPTVRRLVGGPGFGGLARAAVAVAGISAFFLLPNHVPIVIAGSPVFPLFGGVQSVFCAAVMVVIVLTARDTRLAVDRIDGPAGVPAVSGLRGAV